MDGHELVQAVADEVMRRIESRLTLSVEADYVTLAEAARRTSFSYDFVYDAVRRGDLAASRKGQEWRVAVSDLRAWMNRDRAGTPIPTRSELRKKISRLMPGLVP